jgi:hypothetical protein
MGHPCLGGDASQNGGTAQAPAEARRAPQTQGHLPPKTRDQDCLCGPSALPPRGITSRVTSYAHACKAAQIVKELFREVLLLLPVCPLGGDCRCVKDETGGPSRIVNLLKYCCQGYYKSISIYSGSRIGAGRECLCTRVKANTVQLRRFRTLLFNAQRKVPPIYPRWRTGRPSG